MREKSSIRLSSKRGFTLLEIMISLAIIGMLLITLIYTLNYHLSIVEKHEFVTVAVFLAREKIDNLKDLPENVKGAFEEPYSDYSFEIEKRESSLSGAYDLYVTVRHGKEEIRLSKPVKTAM